MRTSQELWQTHLFRSNKTLEQAVLRPIFLPGTGTFFPKNAVVSSLFDGISTRRIVQPFAGRTDRHWMFYLSNKISSLARYFLPWTGTGCLLIWLVYYLRDPTNCLYSYYGALTYHAECNTFSMSSIVILIVSQSSGEFPTSTRNALFSNVSMTAAVLPSFRRTVSNCLIITTLPP